MRTWTGTEAPLQPGVGEVNILDLVMHMGRESRWGGFGSTEWKVGHHTHLTVLLWLKAGYPADKLAYIWAHDAHESYTGDIPSPVKRLLGEGVKNLEAHLDERIREALSLPPPDEDTLKRIKICDLAAMVIEAPLFGPPFASGGSKKTPTQGYGTHGPVIFDHPEIPTDLRAEVVWLVERAIPDLAKIVRRRNGPACATCGGTRRTRNALDFTIDCPDCE
jgi:uncharacterized protein